MVFTERTSDAEHSAPVAFSGTQAAKLIGEPLERDESGRGARINGFADMSRHEDSETISFTDVPSTTRAPSTARSGNPRLQVPEKAKAPLQKFMRPKPGSARNPIDVEALHSTLNRPVPNHYRVNKTRTGSRPGIKKSSYPDMRPQRSIGAGSSLRRQVVSGPVSRGPVVDMRALQGPYEAAGQHLQRICRRLAIEASDIEGATGNQMAPRQSFVTPYHLPQMSDPAQPNPRYSNHVRQYYLIPFSPPYPASPYTNYVSRSGPAPVNYVKSKYHQPAVPTSASLPPTGFYQKSNEEELREKEAQYIQEYVNPCPRKRGMLDGPEATSGVEYESRASFSNKSNGNVPPNTEATANGPSLAAYPQNFTIVGHSVGIATLISHTQRLTELFHFYPHSHDQPRLLENMAALMTVQNLRFQNWLSAERNPHLGRGCQPPTAHASPSGRKTQAMSRNEESDSVVVSESKRVAEEAMETELEQEIEKLLPSSSAVWDNKDGLGARDLYAVTERMSPPVFSEEEEGSDVEG